MKIDTDDWMTSADAARALDVSAQRLDQILGHALLEHLRPWTRTTVVLRADVTARLGGHRPPIITPGQVATFVRSLCEVNTIDELDALAVGIAVRRFSDQYRPSWGEPARSQWVLARVASLAEPAT